MKTNEQAGAAKSNQAEKMDDSESCAQKTATMPALSLDEVATLIT